MKKIALTLAMALCFAPLFAQPKLNKNNIDEVIKAMTLEEKATLLVGSGWGSMVGGLTNSDEVLVSGAAGTTRAIPRLGIPQTVLSDGPAGLRINPTRPGTDKTFYCTGFPVGTSLASTWNTPLVEQLTTAMGEEVKEYGADVLLAPGMNLHRNPLCGRNFEYFSEDPLLTGKMAAAYTRGIQSNGVGVSVKHFAGNSQETNRMANDARINPRALRELYLKGFEIAVKESHPWTIMSSYNKINGPYTQENRDLLYTIVREEWGFDGIVMTDWTGARNTARQIGSINDLLEPGMDQFIGEIIAAVQDGTLKIEDVDMCVRNMLEYIVRTPRFQGYKYSDNPDLEGHAKLVRRAAAEGLVLLENNGVLPLKGVKKVALYGVGSYDFIAGGTGSGNVNKKYVRNIADGLRVNGFEVNGTIENWYQQYIALQKTEMANNAAETNVLLGDPVLAEMKVSRSFVNKMVPQSDIAILTISRNAGEGGDRRAEDGDWTLTGDERKLLQDLCDAYHYAGKPVVVVLSIGGVIETASWKSLPDAVLLAWTPGQEGGYTVADVLSGASYPSGKLPMTFPVAYFDIPSSYNFPFDFAGDSSLNPLTGSDVDEETNDLLAMFGLGSVKQPNVDYTEYKEGIWVGYRYFSTAGKNVSYPFGYGLGYTTFAYSKPSVKVAKDGTVTASITVTNTGSFAGKEAVQLYVTAPDGGLVKPACELRAFAKTGELKPGQSETLTMTIDPYTLASFNEDTSAWETAAGSYTAQFGASVADIRATAPFKIAKAQSWPVHRVLLPKTPIQEISVK